MMFGIFVKSGIRRRALMSQCENIFKSNSEKLWVESTCYSNVTSKKWASTFGPMENDPSYVRRRGSAPLLEKTIGQLLDQAANRYPNRSCVVSMHENIRLTFAEARSRADKFAAGLKKLGLQRGDRIGIWGPDSVDWYITFCAAARAGFKLVCFNPATRTSEIEYYLKKIGARALIAPESVEAQNYAEALRNAKSECPLLEHIIVSTDKHLPGTRRLVDVESLANKVEIEAIAAEQHEISPLDAFPILFTSGTTGQPKAAVLSHRAMTNNSKHIADRLQIADGTHAICPNIPLYHGFGIQCGLLAALHKGATLVLAGSSFKPDTTLNAIVKEKCTVVYGTPTMWMDLIDTQQRVKAPLDSIQIGLTGGSSASTELFDKMRNTLRFDNLGSVYGMTETGITFQNLPGDSDKLAATTIGQLSDHMEAKVVNEKGFVVPFGTPGELLVRGYSAMIGYWDDEVSTNEVFTEDGWFRTGDQFILESNGYGQIVGRIQDTIHRGGENIFPKEIEDFLQTHPAVVEARVYGVSDDRAGEEICAYIRLRDGLSVTPDAIKKFSSGKLAHYKIPRHIHFLDDFPKTSGGEIDKRVLQRSYQV